MRRILLNKEQEKLFLEMCENNATKEDLIKTFHRDRECIQRLVYDYEITSLMTYLYWSESTRSSVVDCIENSQLTKRDIADKCKVGYVDLHYFMLHNYTSEYLKSRSRKMYQQSKLGDKNPMRKAAEDTNHAWRHHDESTDGFGYKSMIAPDWYEGKKDNSGYVAVHILVMCESLGVTKLPEGFCVHHINGKRDDNRIQNLALMTRAAHSYYHVVERERILGRAETIESQQDVDVVE